MRKREIHYHCDNLILFIHSIPGIVYIYIFIFIFIFFIHSIHSISIYSYLDKLEYDIDINYVLQLCYVIKLYYAKQRKNN